MSNMSKPLFMTAEPEEPAAKPDDMTWGDWMLKPGKPLSPRLKRMAQLFAKGHTNNDIAEYLGYTPARVSVVKSNTRMQEEIAKLQDRLFEDAPEKRMKDMLPDALNAIEEILADPDIPVLKKENAARWLVEKVTGKPAQQIDLKGEISIGLFLDKLEQLESSGQVIDITKQPEGGSPKAELDAPKSDEPAVDPLAQWVKDNI